MKQLGQSAVELVGDFLREESFLRPGRVVRGGQKSRLLDQDLERMLDKFCRRSKRKQLMHHPFASVRSSCRYK